MGSNAYMARYMLARYRRRMELARVALGNKCASCGSTVGLELDHIDRTTKAFTISRLWNVPRPRFWAEVRKCQLLCDRCHNDKTMAEKGQHRAFGTHGTLSAMRYCRPICDLCRDARRRWHREYKWAKRRLGGDP